MQAKYAGISLTGPTVYEQTESVGWPVSRQVKMDPGVRTDELYITPLGNKGRTVTLSYWRSYQSVLDAMDASANFIANLPDSGQLEIWQESLGSRLTHIAPACILSCPEPLFFTRSVRFTLSFAVRKLITSRVTADLLRDNTGEVVTDSTGSPVY